MFKLNLSAVFTENRGAGKPFLVFRKVCSIYNVDLFCLLRLFLCNNSASDEKEKYI